MANAENTSTCVFYWTIQNPFLPFRRREAVFFHGSPTVTQWKVSIEPADRLVNYCVFSFCLEFDERFDRRYEITVDDLLIFISLNENHLVDIRGFPYSFNGANKYQYYLQTYSDMLPPIGPNRLFITIRISLPGQPAVYPEPQELLFNDNGLKRLSQDLSRLRYLRFSSNMKLKPAGDEPEAHVHSYILESRWDNFFKLHHFQAGTTTAVESHISFPLLLDILHYMYTGQMSVYWREWSSAPYFSELFQVICRYKLCHLYKVFVPRDLSQVRWTRNSVVNQSRIFPLVRVNGRHINSTSLAWHIIQSPGYDFIFKMYVESRDGPWLSYSLTSRSSFRVYTQVNFEVVRRTQGYVFQRDRFLHECEHVLDANGFISSGRVVFLGCPEVFGIPDICPGTRRDTQLWIRCVLNFSDGTTSEQIGSLDGALRHPLESYHLLSDHMHQLQTSRTGSDLQVVSPSADPGFENRAYVHKGILEARVPGWQRTFQNVPGEAVETVRSTLTSEALPHVLDYIYTGKVSTLPRLILDEIQRFAEQSGFHILLDVVQRFRA